MALLLPLGVDPLMAVQLLRRQAEAPIRCYPRLDILRSTHKTIPTPTRTRVPITTFGP